MSSSHLARLLSAALLLTGTLCQPPQCACPGGCPAPPASYHQEIALINCGSPVPACGYQTDAYAVSNRNVTVSQGSAWIADPGHVATDALVSVRQGPRFSYTFAGLPQGSSVAFVLRFAEWYWGAANGGSCGTPPSGGYGCRRFDVLADGVVVLPALDVYAAAGNRSGVGVSRTLSVTVGASGAIVLAFKIGRDQATVSTIEAWTLTSTPTPTYPPPPTYPASPTYPVPPTYLPPQPPTPGPPTPAPPPGPPTPAPTPGPPTPAPPPGPGTVPAPSDVIVCNAYVAQCHPSGFVGDAYFCYAGSAVGQCLSTPWSTSSCDAQCRSQPATPPSPAPPPASPPPQASPPPLPYNAIVCNAYVPQCHPAGFSGDAYFCYAGASVGKCQPIGSGPWSAGTCDAQCLSLALPPPFPPPSPPSPPPSPPVPLNGSCPAPCTRCPVAPPDAVSEFALVDCGATSDACGYLGDESALRSGVVIPGGNQAGVGGNNALASFAQGASFRYTFVGVVPGRVYAVVMRFAEWYWTAIGKRVFDVVVDGTTQGVSSLDVFAAAGNMTGREVVRQVRVQAGASGRIVVKFAARVDQAVVSVIEVYDLGAKPFPPAGPPAPIASPPPLGPAATTEYAFVENFAYCDPATHPAECTINGLNSTRWTVYQSGVQNNELECYEAGTDTVEVVPSPSTDDGMLRISALMQPQSFACATDYGRGTVWKSGRIVSAGNTGFVWQCDASGYRAIWVSVRAKLPPGAAGLWPAVAWFLPASHLYWGEWSRSGEIDLGETVDYFGQNYNTLSWGTASGLGRAGGSISIPPGTEADWHVYTLEWSPVVMRFYLDWTQSWSIANTVWNKPGNILYNTSAPGAPNPWQCPGGTWSPSAPFDSPFSFVADLAVGGSFPGPPDLGTPANNSMFIDYVIAWYGPRQTLPAGYWDP